MKNKLARGTKGSVVVENCQVCGSTNLSQVIFLGYLPPVNTMPPVGTPPQEQAAYPAQLLECGDCKLVQLGLVVDPEILFPPNYPYTSGTTRILRENFAQLYEEASTLLDLKKNDLIVDIGSNDGTLLSSFHENGHRVLGIEPTNTGKLAQERGITTQIEFFGPEAVKRAEDAHGKAAVITAANVFAHIENVQGVMESLLELLDDDGVFISESHYWIALVETLQYDAVYHEHLRYYSLTALNFLLNRFGLEAFHATRIPTHGGSIRVYAARKGRRAVQSSIAEIVDAEANTLSGEGVQAFRDGVVDSKLALHALLRDVKSGGSRIVGIGAPSRSTTLINYAALDDGIIDCVYEIPGSYKIGKYVPGTLIPVLSEIVLYEHQPEYAFVFSWHIADELCPKLKAKGFSGDFIIPLPKPRILKSSEVSGAEPLQNQSRTSGRHSAELSADRCKSSVRPI